MHGNKKSNSNRLTRLSRLTRKTKKGGEVIDIGAYGCVFYPALKCKNKKTRTNGISKLSLKQDSIKEWNIYKKIVNLLKVIPNYKKYFLLDNFSVCEPDLLTKKDKETFNKCDIFDNYDGGNINNSLNNFMIINMPHGGRNLDIVINNNLISFNDFNILLNNLIINGVMPMNKLDIYHFDLKASNILYKNNNLTIIDFGTLDFKNKDNIIPKRLLNSSGIQYNSPFSNILFNSFFQRKINHSLKSYILSKKQLNFLIIFKIFKNIYNEFVYHFSDGHESFFKTYFLTAVYTIKNKKPENFKDIIRDLICKYCSCAIFKYFDLKTYEFNIKKYFETIYSKNVDIYGILSCYIHYIVSPNKNYSNSFKSNILAIIDEYVLNYKYAVKVIPIKEVMNKLTKTSM